MSQAFRINRYLGLRRLAKKLLLKTCQFIQVGGSCMKHQQEGHQLVGRGKTPRQKIRPRTVESGIFSRSFNSDNCRLKVASDVISGAAVAHPSFDAHVKRGDSSLNMGRIITLLPAVPVLNTFVEFFIANYIREEATGDVISS